MLIALAQQSAVTVIAEIRYRTVKLDKVLPEELWVTAYSAVRSITSISRHRVRRAALNQDETDRKTLII
jgi:hypothetical protein